MKKLEKVQSQNVNAFLKKKDFAFEFKGSFIGIVNSHPGKPEATSFLPLLIFYLKMMRQALHTFLAPTTLLRLGWAKAQFSYLKGDKTRIKFSGSTFSLARKHAEHRGTGWSGRRNVSHGEEHVQASQRYRQTYSPGWVFLKSVQRYKTWGF